MSDFLTEIHIADIDLTDERYKLSLSKTDTTFLEQSIREAGILYPPIVRWLNNKFIIVSGFNRISAMIRNSSDSNTKAKIVVCKTNSKITECQCHIQSITALAFKRPLTPAELILAIQRLSQFMDNKQIAKKSSGVFNMELSIQFIDDLLTIGALPAPALELIHHGNLSFKTAKRIASFDNQTQTIFLIVFSKIKASNNKQLEILQHVKEIIARDAINPERFFKNRKIQDILSDENKAPGIKTEELRSWLYEKRFPSVFKKYQTVKEKITAIPLVKDIKFLPPENFESQNYSISFTAKTYTEFAIKVQNLKDVLEHSLVKEIFTP